MKFLLYGERFLKILWDIHFTKSHYTKSAKSVRFYNSITLLLFV